MGCTTIHRVCVEGEQLVLHGPNANAELNATYALLRKARDSLDGFRYLHAERHSTVMLAREAASPYSYVPLAVSVSHSKSSLTMTRAPAFAEERTFSKERALVFFHTYPSSFAETYFRAALRVFEYSCYHAPEALHLRPSFWSPGARLLLS